MMKLKITIILIMFLPISINSYSFDREDLNVEVKANLSQTYDDNIAYDSVNAKKDMITKISLSLGLK